MLRYNIKYLVCQQLIAICHKNPLFPFVVKPIMSLNVVIGVLSSNKTSQTHHRNGIYFNVFCQEKSNYYYQNCYYTISQIIVNGTLPTLYFVQFGLTIYTRIHLLVPQFQQHSATLFTGLILSEICCIIFCSLIRMFKINPVL